MPLDIWPRFSSKDHSHHVASDIVIGCNNSIWSSSVISNIASLFRGEFPPSRSVFSLFFAICRPDTIRRMISSIIVYAFNGDMPFGTARSWSHVSKKILESVGSRPTLTNGYPTGLVAFGAGIFSTTSYVDFVPNRVFCSVVHIVPPVDGWSSGGFGVEAPARCAL